MKKTTHKLHISFIHIFALLIAAQLICSLFLSNSNSNSNVSASDTYNSVSLETLLDLPLLNLKPTQATINDLRSSLSLDLSQVEYLELVKKVLMPSEDALGKLSQNGFVAIPKLYGNTMEDVYCTVFLNDLPVFITTDSILHLYHLMFDNLLKNVEKEYLIPMIKQLTSQLLQKSLELYLSSSNSLKNAAKEILRYFSVATSLIDSSVSIPSPVRDEATTIVSEILDAKVVELYPGEDYTQYKPRGHYEKDPELRLYFRCMMWLGRKIFDINKDDHLFQAVVATKLLFSMEETLSLWRKIYQVTSLFVGVADSLTPLSLHNATCKVFGDDYQLDLFEDTENLQQLKTELKKSEYTASKIFSSVIYDDIHSEPMEFPKIFQFMGQRFVPDSYVLQNVTYDRVLPYNGNVRLLGSGLDVAAVLGSERAVQNLKPEIQKYNYKQNLDSLSDEFSEFPKEYWESSLYFSWLYTLRPLLTTIPDESYPSFMQTLAWQDEKLNTVLGSWAQLRHDTILYAKQPYSIGLIICGIPTGYVEPYPEFYKGIRALCIETVNFLNEVQVLSSSWKNVLNEMADITQTLFSISEKELNGTALTEEEMDFIRDVAVVKDGGVCGVPPTILGWYPSLIEKASIEDSKVPCIADVMTAAGDPEGGQPPQVLHAATGYVNFIIVIYEAPKGEKIAAVGPVFTYYEFPMLGFQRLCDSEWEEMLQKGTAPQQPSWTDTYTS